LSFPSYARNKKIASFCVSAVDLKKKIQAANQTEGIVGAKQKKGVVQQIFSDKLRGIKPGRHCEEEAISIQRN